MNKTKLMVAGTGGAMGLVALVLAFLVWQALSAKTVALEGDDEEGVEGLEAVESRAQSLSRKPVYPSAESLAAIEENQTLVDDWSREALALAARGDKTFGATTPPAFKTFLVADARRVAELPGGVAGKLVKPDFAFGPFRDYIAEGKMPAEAELAALQRKWDDVATVSGVLSRCGVTELADVQFGAPAAKEPEETKGKGDRRHRRLGAKAASSSQEAEQSVSSQSYVFTFFARPAAFVRTVNELAACERFVSVDEFSFARQEDAIAEALGGDEKRDQPSASAGRRGRRGRRVAEVVEQKPQTGDADAVAAKNGVVTDPLLDGPFKVVMTVSVHDFGSLGGKGEGSDEKGVSK